MKKNLIFGIFLGLALIGVGLPFSAHGASNFVNLTSLPGLDTVASGDNLPAFFNAIYKICIGVAATVAVLQIILTGIMYMGGDSVTETKQAREKIQKAVIGLIVVLSPALVFSIINPKILNLQIGFSSLVSSPATPAATPAPVADVCKGQTFGNGDTIPTTIPIECCTRQPGYTVQTGIKTGRGNTASTCVQPGNSCPVFRPLGPSFSVSGQTLIDCCNAQAPRCGIKTSQDVVGHSTKTITSCSCSS